MPYQMPAGVTEPLDFIVDYYPSDEAPLRSVLIRHCADIDDVVRKFKAEYGDAAFARLVDMRPAIGI